MASATCVWPLSPTETLEFTVFTENADWNDVPGLYIFSYQDGRSWYAVYVGQADSFQKRIPGHERLKEAGQLGATHIHARVVNLQAERNRLEKMLIQRLQPTLNVQHK